MSLRWRDISPERAEPALPGPEGKRGAEAPLSFAVQARFVYRPVSACGLNVMPSSEGGNGGKGAMFA